MGYDWDAHKETCYRLYIGEKKTLEDIISYMRVHHRFNPRQVGPAPALVVPPASP